MKDLKPALRPMAPEDLIQVEAIEKMNFFDPWTEEMLKSELLANRNIEAFTLKAGPEILGYYFAWHIAGQSDLSNLAVKKAFQGRGLGRILFQHFLDQGRKKGSRDFFLEVAVDNEPALALYSAFGFEILSRRKNYYSKEHKDAFVMKYQPKENFSGGSLPQERREDA